MREFSLRRALAVRLTSAIVALLALDAVACYYTAEHFANLVYDRWLIDSTRSLGQALKVTDGHVVFDLPHVALEVFQFDEVDKTYFRIASKRSGFVAGYQGLPVPPLPAQLPLQLFDEYMDGRSVRLVATQLKFPEIDDKVTVEVAETLNKRARLAHEILLAMVAPQLALLIVGIGLLWFGIGLGLKPLTDLAAQIETRDHDNLAAVPEEKLPLEARTLVSKINDLLARLSNVLQSQRRFLTDAAHQLRTPLAAIMLYAERAQRAAQSVEEQQALHGLHSAVERAARLSHQLLALARAEQGAGVASPLTKIDLCELARTIGEEWIQRALHQRADFGLVVPSAAVWIDGNNDLLGEMLSNLLDNAIRYGGAGCEVTLTVAADPAPALIVEDDGPGIPEGDRPHIFERFYRGSAGGRGCGLGLAIVKDIAGLHGAIARFGPGQNGIGTRFVIEFPSVAAASTSSGVVSVKLASG